MTTSELDDLRVAVDKQPRPSAAQAARDARPPHGQPRWVWRAGTLAAACVAMVTVAARTALAQDGDAVADAAADGGGGASSLEAWVLPFRNLEPVTIVIILCSILAVTLIVQGILRVRRGVILPEASTAEIESLIQQRNFKQLVEFTEADTSFVSESLHPALKRAPNFDEMREALENGVAEQTAREFRRLEYINILANVGPLLGLLGTVIGIMAAFLEMQRAGGNAAVGSLAGGISTALGTTMLGLLLAIPCLVAYGLLRNRADTLTTEGANLAEQFLLMIKPDGKPSSSASPSPSRPQQAPSPQSAARQSRTRAPSPDSPKPAAS